MASSTADMCTMGGSDIFGGVPLSSIQDVKNHPDTKLPPPGWGPAMKHSTAMAGDQVLPITGKVNQMQQMK